MSPFLKANRRTFNAIAKAIVTFVEESEHADAWQSASLDVRFPPEGGSCFTRFLIHTDSRAISGWDPEETAPLVDRLWAVRSRHPDDVWYGFVIRIPNPGDDYEVEFHRDSDCTRDPSFWPAL